MAVANCPSCGGRIEFAIGSSVVVVCDYCRTVVARTDRALEDLGKVAALVDTGSPLHRDLPGKYHGVGFRIVGRTQMRHQAGGVWDEWYAAFDDGRWGWLAEAQGKYYVTFKTAAGQLPTREQIAVGGRLDGMVVTEVGTATVISGEGEIPWKVVPNSTYDYADLSGAQGHFATIDYSEETPLLFKGQETSLRDLGIDVAQEPRRDKGVRVAKLSCSKCGGALNLVAPDQAERVICPNCGAMHDVVEGNLRFLEALKLPPHKPRIPLASRGKVDGDEYAVAGFVVRSVTFDRKYLWTEYLLFNPAKGFRWLVDSDDHWSFVGPIAAGDVDDRNRASADTAPTLGWQAKTFKVFQDAPATVEYVLGEFYWKVSVGEKVRAIDYIAPPEGITIEYAGGDGGAAEVNYSLGRYMPVAEVEQAFAIKNLPQPTGVGMLQPNPTERIGDVWAKLALALVVVAIILAVTRSRHEVFNDMVYFGQPAIGSLTAPSQPSQWGSDSGRIVFTKPFPLSGGRNLMIEGFSPDDSLQYIGADLIDQKGSIVESFDLPIGSGEGNRKRDVYLAAKAAGTYSMRLEGQRANTATNPKALITVQEGVFRWPHLWMAFFVLTVPAAVLAFRPMAFENARWQESMYTRSGNLRGSGSGSSSSDDDND